MDSSGAKFSKFRSGLIVGCWHNPDIHIAAPEGRFTGGLPTFGAECLVSGGKPTEFQRALKVGS
jgi:hypothetical protein